MRKSDWRRISDWNILIIRNESGGISLVFRMRLPYIFHSVLGLKKFAATVNSQELIIITVGLVDPQDEENIR